MLIEQAALGSMSSTTATAIRDWSCVQLRGDVVIEQNHRDWDSILQLGFVDTAAKIGECLIHMTGLLYTC
ncbi:MULTISPECIES: hypothetical protein [Azohydromonas]|jgi:hypothetical protein|uniref:Uncharacterized protein n=1 Tax=Azohydromonas lata TaxID=45677 RepID=A0ABU5IA00_9BURK|nr:MULTISPECIES: hypothetical protein [Azohydromonas]MDZ5455679.1 hypothetical protein [Azohydromonas lata]